MEFQVRRAPGNFPFSIRLDHGDALVTDGPAQSEYEHCTASEPQGPRVNLTYRWVAQHTASCPLAGVVGCLLPTCAQGLVEPGSRGLGEGENKWSSSWGLVLLLLILVCVLLVGTLINIRRWGIVTVVSVHPTRWCTAPPGSCPLGWETALAIVTTLPFSKKKVFLFLLNFSLISFR